MASMLQMRFCSLSERNAASMSELEMRPPFYLR